MGCSAQNLTRERYLPSFTFQDPIAKADSLEAFALNLRLLRTVFDIDFDLLSCRVGGPTELVTRCARQQETPRKCFEALVVLSLLCAWPY